MSEFDKSDCEFLLDIVYIDFALLAAGKPYLKFFISYEFADLADTISAFELFMDPNPASFSSVYSL